MAALAAATLVLLNSYFRMVEHSMRARAQAVSREVADNLRFLVESHVRVLQTLGELEVRGFEDGGDRFLLTAEALLHHYEGFYAINFVDRNAVIRHVYPYERNKSAIGGNLLRKADSREYLLLSRERRIPVMSHKIQTYQGIEAAAINVPLVKNGEFRGWINGVVDLNGWLRHEIASRPGNLSVRLSWSEQPDSVLELGPWEGRGSSRVEFDLLNQRLIVEVGVPDEEPRAMAFEVMVFVAALLLLVTVTVLLFWLGSSLGRLRSLNRRLRLKNALVSSLAHDMGTPLTVLTIGLDKLREDPSSEKTWDRLRRSAETLRQMLSSVRLLHAMEIGRLEMNREAVDLSVAVKGALDHVAEMAAAKGVRLFSEVPNHLPAVLAEPATLSQNVIPNVLTNAIKFTPAGGEILIRATTTDGIVMLTVRDSGAGIPPEKLQALLGDDAIDSNVGTAGETGSGLGMVQVRTFMEIYDGSFRVESRTEGEDHGTTVALTFKRAGSNRT